jgi:hypothetical protein
MSTYVDNVDKVMADLVAGRFRSLRAAAFANSVLKSTLSARIRGRPRRADIDPSS